MLHQLVFVDIFDQTDQFQGIILLEQGLSEQNMLDKVLLLLQECKTGIFSEIKRLFECPRQIFSCLVALIHFSNDS